MCFRSFATRLWLVHDLLLHVDWQHAAFRLAVCAADALLWQVGWNSPQWLNLPSALPGRLQAWAAQTQVARWARGSSQAPTLAALACHVRPHSPALVCCYVLCQAPCTALKTLSRMYFL